MAATDPSGFAMWYNSIYGGDDSDRTLDQFGISGHDNHMKHQDTTNTRSSDDLPPVVSPPPTLPDGRVIDSKNTLESIAVAGTYPLATSTSTATTATATTTATNGSSSATTIPGDIGPSNSNEASPLRPLELRLPDGRIIDGKNTLGSFAVPPIADRLVTKRGVIEDMMVIPPAPVLETNHTPNPHSSSNPNNTNSGDTVHVQATLTVQAEPVEERSLPLVVDAELADSRIQLPWPSKRGTSFWLLMAAIVIIAALVSVIGGYCGAGKCSRSTPATSMSINESPAPPTPVSAAPTIFPPATNPPSHILTDDPTLSRVATDTPTQDPTVPPVVMTNVPVSTIIQPVTSSPVTARPTTIAPTTFSPTTISPTTLPTISPIIDELVIACNFLSLTNLSDCLATTMITFIDAVNSSTTIPTELGLLTQLTFLNLTYSGLNSTIPSEVGSLTQLTWLDLSFNQLSGSIPSELGNMTHLDWLDFSDNLLTGDIPFELGQLTQLTWLDLSSNQLTGTIPFTFGQLTQLTSLYLSNIRLNDTIPSTLGLLTQLKFLWLFENTQLTGTIPSNLCSRSEIGIYIDCANVECTCCVNSTGDSCI